MKLKEGGSDFEQLEPGIYGAVCTRVIDFGTQPGFKPDDKPSHQVLLGFEVDKFMADGRPFYIMLTAYAGLGKAEKPTKLCVFLEGMRGKKFTADERAGFDIKKVLGATCELVVGLSAGGKSKPTAAARPRVPVELKPEKLVYFSMDPESPTITAFDDLSKWEKGKVQTSPEWEKVKNMVVHGDGAPPPTDDIPF
jgi:hypothetical protein